MVRGEAERVSRLARSWGALEVSPASLGFNPRPGCKLTCNQGISAFYFILFYLFLAASGLSCSTRAPRCGARAPLYLWRAGFLFSSCSAGSRAHGLCSLRHAGSS